MNKINKITLYCLFALFALFALFVTTAKAQEAAGETISYSFDRVFTEGVGWFFVQTTTTTRPDGSIIVNTLQTFRATEAEIDTFIVNYKRGLDQEVEQSEAMVNDFKARRDAAAPVGPSVIFFRTGGAPEIVLPDNTIKPEAGSVWQYDGTGYVPYVCPAPKKKAPVKTTKTTKPKKQ